MSSVRLSVCLSVCLSVRPTVRLHNVQTLVDQDHISWNSWKLIARTISPTYWLFDRSPKAIHLLPASVGISALGRTSIQFVDTGVKVNGDYYNNVLLMQGLLR